MSKIAVVYWSGTGNTEAMAAAVVEGAKEKGAEVSLLTASEFSPEQVSEYDAIAFGCPSMGSEQLEESEFEPMFTACEGRLSGPGRGPRLRKQRGAGILHGHLLVSLNTFAPRGDLQSFAGCSILWLADTNHKRGIAP